MTKEAQCESTIREGQIQVALAFRCGLAFRASGYPWVASPLGK
jgi:hypothetical protein